MPDYTERVHYATGFLTFTGGSCPADEYAARCTAWLEKIGAGPEETGIAYRGHIVPHGGRVVIPWDDQHPLYSGLAIVPVAAMRWD